MAKIADIAKNLFNLGKGIGLEKPREGNQKEFNLDKFKSELQSLLSRALDNNFFPEQKSDAHSMDNGGLAKRISRLMFFLLLIT